MWGLNKDTPFILVPKSCFKLHEYMVSHVFLMKIGVWVCTIFCWSWDYDNFHVLEIEIHEYAEILMHNAEIPDFYMIYESLWSLVCILMSLNSRLNYELVSPSWELQFYEILCYKHLWFEYFEIIEKYLTFLVLIELESTMMFYQNK